MPQAASCYRLLLPIKLTTSPHKNEQQQSVSFIANSRTMDVQGGICSIESQDSENNPVDGLDSDNTLEYVFIAFFSKLTRYLY